MKHTPESLNLWDRFFNRYRKEVIRQGKELWYSYQFGYFQSYQGKIPYHRDFVEYRIIDRVTGSETIKKEYLN